MSKSMRTVSNDPFAKCSFAVCGCCLAISAKHDRVLVLGIKAWSVYAVAVVILFTVLLTIRAAALPNACNTNSSTIT